MLRGSVGSSASNMAEYTFKRKAWTTLINSSQANFMGERLLTHMTTTFTGVVNSSAANAGTFALCANQLYQPFNMSSFCDRVGKHSDTANSGITSTFSSAKTQGYNGYTVMQVLHRHFHRLVIKGITDFRLCRDCFRVIRFTLVI